MICPRCNTNPKLPKRGYCAECRNAYQREWRRGRIMSDVERLKARCRARSHYLTKTGEIPTLCCSFCGDEKAERHHPDYSDPKLVKWLCLKCHRLMHKIIRQNMQSEFFAMWVQFLREERKKAA